MHGPKPTVELWKAEEVTLRDESVTEGHLSFHICHINKTYSWSQCSFSYVYTVNIILFTPLKMTCTAIGHLATITFRWQKINNFVSTSWMMENEAYLSRKGKALTDSLASLQGQWSRPPTLCLFPDAGSAHIGGGRADSPPHCTEWPLMGLIEHERELLEMRCACVSVWIGMHNRALFSCHP